jgi:protoheme IX farnesyltransferase
MSDLASSPAASTALGTPGDYFKLLKPRVMSLVVFTALTGLVCADTPINPALAAIAIFCIAIGAGASGAMNMALEGDVDIKMRRTRNRPVPQGKVSRGDAFAFGAVLAAFSVMLMGLGVNLAAALLLAATIGFYVVIYTLWLKRATPQNIVIGGAAGALPPVVGWAAASGHAPLDAWLLFAIIFLWTPPHFWALSLYTAPDYAKAGIPMLPVVKGAKATRLQILLYSLVLAPLGAAPALTGLGGPVYAIASVVGGLIFVALAIRVFLSKAGEGEVEASGLYTTGVKVKAARDLFAFSLLYLTVLFAVLLGEHSLKALHL